MLGREGTGEVVGGQVPSQLHMMKGSFSTVPCSGVKQSFVVKTL